MTHHDPMTEAERTLLEHRWAARVNLPADVMHAARTARWAVDHASYASLEAPAAVVRAVEVLEGWAVAVDQRVKADRARRVASGMDDAHFQRELEQSSEEPPLLTRPHDWPPEPPEPGSSPPTI